MLTCNNYFGFFTALLEERFITHPHTCNLIKTTTDPAECDLQKARSHYYPESNRYFSYATCDWPDVFKSDINSLSGTVIKVGMIITPGGWKGAYNKVGWADLKGPLENWSGPIVELLHEAARIGNFTLDLVEEFPPMIVNHSRSFFGIANTNYQPMHLHG